MQIKKVYRKDLQEWRWKIDITIDGKRIRRADFVSKQEAIEAIGVMLANARADRYGLSKPRPKITLGQLKDKTEKTKTSWIFDDFVTLIGKDTQLADLTKADWQKYLNSLAARKLKANSVNRYLTAVSSALHSASRIFPDLENWTAPQAPWLPDSPSRSRLLSQKELGLIFQALLSKRESLEKTASAKCRREVYDLLRLMLLTGAREGEILNLRQSQVSWDWKTVRIESKKGGGLVRVVPLSESALAILRSRTKYAPRFFPEITPGQLQKALKRAAKISGIAYGDKIDGGWVAYDLRHVAGTVMESAGIPYSAVSAILGHKRKDQTASYTHAQLDTLRRAVETLETWCREIDGGFHTGHQKTPTTPPNRKQA